MGLLAAPEHTGGARLQRQSGGVAGDIGPALIDDGDDPHWDGGLLDHQPVGPLHPAEDSPHRVREGRHLPDPLRHAGDPVRAEGQPVQHHLGDAAPGPLQIQGVGRQDGGRVRLQLLRHGQQGPVLGLCIRQSHGPSGLSGTRKQFLCGHPFRLLVVLRL